MGLYLLHGRNPIANMHQTCVVKLPYLRSSWDQRSHFKNSAILYEDAFLKIFYLFIHEREREEEREHEQGKEQREEREKQTPR